jgi:hypothetical protein
MSLKLKQYALETFRRDHSGKTYAEAPIHNLRVFGAQHIHETIGPTSWPENFGQSPFDTSYSVACTIVNRDEDRKFFNDTERAIFEALAEDPGVNPPEVVAFIETLIENNADHGFRR